MLAKIIAISTLVSGVALILLLQMTNPSTVGPLGLLTVFFLLYVVILGVVTEVLWLGSHVMQVIGRRFAVKRPVGRLSLARAYYFSSILALAPVMALAMLSIGSLGMYEGLLIGAFLLIGILYVAKRS